MPLFRSHVNDESLNRFFMSRDCNVVEESVAAMKSIKNNYAVLLQ